MTGLDKIVEQILEQAEQVASEFKAEGQEEAAKITAKAHEDGKEQAQEILEKSEIEYKDIIARGESAAALHIRKENLKAKQEIISTMLGSAKKSILELPEKEYCSLILKMIEKNSTKDNGQIAFNQNDLKKITNIQKEFSKYNLTLSKTSVDIDGGFILIYGDIEVNCSISALFDGAEEKLQDKVQSILFSK